MRKTSFLIRLVVFCCVAFDPSGGGAGVAIGVAIGLMIGAISAAFVGTNTKTTDANDENS